MPYELDETTDELPEGYDDIEEDSFLADFLSQVQKDRNWALNYYSARDQEFERMEAWYFKEHYSGDAEYDAENEPVMEESIDEGEHQTIINIPTNIINSVHGILTDELPYIEAISSTGRKSEKAASNTEKFLYGVNWINTQINGEDAWEAAAQDMLIYGWGCVYSYYDPDRAKLMRKQQSRKDPLDFYAFPLVEKRIHPKDIYPLPNGVRERWRGVLWILNKTVREVEEEWGCDIRPRPLMNDDGDYIYDEEGNIIYEQLSEDDLIEYIDYWVWRRNDEGEWMLWHCVVAGDQFVKEPTEMPEYEMLPFEIFFCRKSPSDSGSRLGLSFLYPIIEPVQEMELLANRSTRIIEQYADPILVIEDQAGSSDDEIEKGPGTIIYVNPGGSARWLTYDGQPPDVARMMNLWREQAQDAFPPVMTGLQGGTSGLDTIALQQGGKLQTNKPRRNLELARERVNTKYIRLLQKFFWDEPVHVIGQRPENDENVPFNFMIKGKDTRGFEHTRVTIRGRFPQEELRNVVLASNAVGAGLLSGREASSKYMYVQDPDRSFRLQMQERLMRDPKWAEWIFTKYMQLEARSPVTEALMPPEDRDAGVMVGADELGAGLTAAATADDLGSMQELIQQTPVESNRFSAAAGGTPFNG